MVSSERLSGTTPSVLIMPMVGLKPTQPQSPAGIRIEPPASEPTAQSHMPATTAAAEPPEDPPGIRLGSRGLRTVPWCGLLLVIPNAHSWRLVLPTTTQP